MPDLTKLALELDDNRATCRPIIETPKGFRNKFTYDPATTLFKLGGVLPEGTTVNGARRSRSRVRLAQEGAKGPDNFRAIS